MIREIQAKSILIKRRKIDSWFISHYGMNLYRGCTHNCVYCDGRAETYRVTGEFGRDIEVKTNAIELLAKELDPARKRKPMAKSYMVIGGGVCDAYQPAEERYQLTRQTLALMAKHKYPIHILTKSTLVERDVDLLQTIHRQNRVIISFSFSTVDDRIGRLFEPGVPSPGARLATIARLKKQGFDCGMFLLPIIPFVSDTPAMLAETIKAAKTAGVDFIIFGGMTLKDGRQKEYFNHMLHGVDPRLLPRYAALYKAGEAWGQAEFVYSDALAQRVYRLCQEYHVPVRIPPALYQDMLSKTDLAVVILEQLDYLLKLQRQKSQFGYAAYIISQLKEPLENLSPEQLSNMKGVGPTSAKIIDEIIATGQCAQHQQLLFT